MARDTSVIGNCDYKEAKEISYGKQFHTEGVDLVLYEGEGRVAAYANCSSWNYKRCDFFFAMIF